MAALVPEPRAAARVMPPSDPLTQIMFEEESEVEVVVCPICKWEIYLEPAEEDDDGN